MRQIGILAGAGLLTLAAAAATLRPGADAARADGSGVVVVPAAAASSATAQTGATSANTTATSSCVAGTWTTSSGDLPIRRESDHFAFRWNGDLVSSQDAKRAVQIYEHVYDVFINQVGFVAPSCATATKLKININFIPDVGPSGGLDANGNPGMWVSPSILDQLPTLAHELTHALQGASGGLRDSPYAGWFWESHAEYMAAQLPELRSSFTGCTMNTVAFPHFAYGFAPYRYCGWQFLEYLKNKYGYAAVNDLWTKSPRANASGAQQADVLSVLMQNMGWNIAQLNNFFGEWALRNVNWDYVSQDGFNRGSVFRAAYGSNDANDSWKRLRTAVLDPISLSNRSFSIPFLQAPQRLGYNLVRVYPDANATSVTVRFRGVTQSTAATTSFPGLANEPSSVEAPASGWRWGLVAIGSDGAPRYSALSASSNASLSFATRTGDKSLWLVVLAAPTKVQKLLWNQAYYSVYRYPWMVQFVNAMPGGFQPNAPKPTSSGHAHANGGGWVADGATVASTAYVGPYARVLGGTVSGNARIEDHAVVASGTVSGRAIVGALSLIDENSVIKDDAQIATAWEGIRASTVSGTAKNLGDANYYGYSMSKGTFYGPIESPDQLTDPARGANRTTAVPEVTAKPTYSW